MLRKISFCLDGNKRDIEHETKWSSISVNKHVEIVPFSVLYLLFWFWCSNRSKLHFREMVRLKLLRGKEIPMHSSLEANNIFSHFFLLQNICLYLYSFCALDWINPRLWIKQSQPIQNLCVHVYLICKLDQRMCLLYQFKVHIIVPKQRNAFLAFYSNIWMNQIYLLIRCWFSV